MVKLMYVDKLALNINIVSVCVDDINLIKVVFSVDVDDINLLDVDPLTSDRIESLKSEASMLYKISTYKLLV